MFKIITKMLHVHKKENLQLWRISCYGNRKRHHPLPGWNALISWRFDVCEDADAIYNHIVCHILSNIDLFSFSTLGSSLPSRLRNRDNLSTVSDSKFILG